MVSLDEIRYGLFQYRKRYGLHAMCGHLQKGGAGIMVSIPQAVWIACNTSKCFTFFFQIYSFNTASGMDCMQCRADAEQVQSVLVSIPQAVWIACNDKVSIRQNGDAVFQYRKRYGLHAMAPYVSAPRLASLFQYRKRYGLHAIVSVASSKSSPRSFNTASGMDCMQYRPSQPLGQLNPEAGFLNGSLFLANRRNLAGFFCRQNRLKTSANPVIPRKLLSTGKI